MTGLCGVYNPREEKLWLRDGCLRVTGSNIRGEKHRLAPNLPSKWLIGMSWLNIRWCFTYSQTLRSCSTDAKNEYCDNPLSGGEMVWSVKGASQNFWNSRSPANTRSDKVKFPTEPWPLVDCLQCLKSLWALTFSSSGDIYSVSFPCSVPSVCSQISIFRVSLLPSWWEYDTAETWDRHKNNPQKPFFGALYMDKMAYTQIQGN